MEINELNKGKILVSTKINKERLINSMERGSGEFYFRVTDFELNSKKDSFKLTRDYSSEKEATIYYMNLGKVNKYQIPSDANGIKFIDLKKHTNIKPLIDVRGGVLGVDGSVAHYLEEADDFLDWKAHGEKVSFKMIGLGKDYTFYPGKTYILSLAKLNNLKTSRKEKLSQGNLSNKKNSFLVKIPKGRKVLEIFISGHRNIPFVKKEGREHIKVKNKNEYRYYPLSEYTRFLNCSGKECSCYVDNNVLKDKISPLKYHQFFDSLKIKINEKKYLFSEIFKSGENLFFENDGKMFLGVINLESKKFANIKKIEFLHKEALREGGPLVYGHSSPIKGAAAVRGSDYCPGLIVMPMYESKELKKLFYRHAFEDKLSFNLSIL